MSKGRSRHQYYQPAVPHRLKLLSRNKSRFGRRRNLHENFAPLDFPENEEAATAHTRNARKRSLGEPFPAGFAGVDFEPKLLRAPAHLPDTNVAGARPLANLLEPGTDPLTAQQDS